jgi:hypothetical protein
MKISKQYLKQVIVEELEKHLKEDWKNKLTGLAIGASALMGGMTPTIAKAEPVAAVDVAKLGSIQDGQINFNRPYSSYNMALKAAEFIAKSHNKNIARTNGVIKNDEGKIIGIKGVVFN